MIFDAAEFRIKVLEAVRDDLKSQVDVLTKINNIIDSLDKNSPADREIIAFLQAEAIRATSREN